MNLPSRMKNFLKKKAFRVLAGIILLPVLAICFYPKPEDHSLQVDIYYTGKLEDLQVQLGNLQSLCASRARPAQLQTVFKQVRLRYKKLAPLLEYFNPGESRYLNGPPVNWSQEDVPDFIIPPHGFQALETILYEGGDSLYKKASRELAEMRSRLRALEEETERRNKFTAAAVWDALRMAVLKVTVLDITGYESPMALAGLQEAAAQLDAIASIVSFYADDMDPAYRSVYAGFNTRLNTCRKRLLATSDFYSADRLALIKDFLNPLYGQLVRLRKMLGIPLPPGRYVVNANTESVFDLHFFNLNAFAPEKEYLPTTERIVLGKKLFYDSILSGTGTRSCASCHQPAKAFTDGLQRPIALETEQLLNRNTPTLFNAGFQTRQFMDSREDILENQINAVVHNVDEMKGSLEQVARRLKQDSGYSLLFHRAYPKAENPFAPFLIGNAIASYIRSLVSLNARFDQYMRGQLSQLSAAEKRGFNLFTGKARCATCHFIPLFNGLVPPFFSETESEILGVPAAPIGKKPRLDPDEGKSGFTRSQAHQFAFKIPTLRNSTRTAPYMHNGVYKTLEEVMQFYNQGGGKGLGIGPESQTLPGDKLRLRPDEVRDIIRFLGALTDTTAAFRTVGLP